MTSPAPIDLSTHGYCVQKWIGHWFHSMGDLYMARRNDATDHIIREIKHGLLDDTNDVVKEVVILRQLRHPHIIDCSSCFIHGDGLYIITPNFPYGAITDILETSYQHGLPEKVISSVVYQTIMALEYIHSKSIVHRGIRSSHLLVDFHGKITLCGFRGAIQLPDGKHATVDFERNLTTMLPWLAPEVITQSLTGYNQKSDIYSLGVTICELANGIVPFREMEPLRMLYQKGLMLINPRIVDNSTCNNTATIPEHRNRFLSKTIHDFTNQCIRENQYTRPSATQLLSHPFIKSKRRNCLKYLDMALTLNQVHRESTRDPSLVEILSATVAPEWDYRPYERDDDELETEEDTLTEDSTQIDEDSEDDEEQVPSS